MKGFPKKIATGNDLYNCLSLVQTGELPAKELSAAIEAVEERQYVSVPIVEVSEDRKTVVINACTEVAEGAKVKGKYTTTIKEKKHGTEKAIRKVLKTIAKGKFEKLDDLFEKYGLDLGVVDPDTSATAPEENSENEGVLTVVSLSRALDEGESVLKIFSDISPFDVLGISADDVQSIKGVLKNYALSDK